MGMNGWCLSDLERGNNQVRSPCLPSQLSCLQWCKGNEGSKEGRWHREVTQWRNHIRVPPVSVGQSCSAFSHLLGCYRSPLSLKWSALWGITEIRRCGEGQDALGSRNHRAFAALLNSGNPFGPVCWKFKEYLIERWLFSSLCLIHFP